MNIEWIVALFNLADQAKNVSEYKVANLCFALIFDAILDCRDDHALVIEWESDDYTETYYDIAVVRLEKKNLSLCIPGPLLNKEAALIAIKLAASKKRLIDRIDHKRKSSPPSDGSSKECWQKLSELTSRQNAVWAAFRVLDVPDPEAESKDRELTKAVIEENLPA